MGKEYALPTAKELYQDGIGGEYVDGPGFAVPDTVLRICDPQSAQADFVPSLPWPQPQGRPTADRPEHSCRYLASGFIAAIWPYQSLLRNSSTRPCFSQLRLQTHSNLSSTVPAWAIVLASATSL